MFCKAIAMATRFGRTGEARGLCAIHWLAIGTAVAALVQQANNAWADVLTLQSGVSPAITYQTQDAHVRNDPANVETADNNTRILFGLLPTGVLRGLYSYPLTDIPAGSTINSVEFHVMQIDTDTNAAAVGGDLSVELRTISETFPQGTGNPTAPTGGSSWNTTFGATMDFGGTILSSATMNPKPEILPIQGDTSTWIDHTFATSASFVSAVQAQLNASQPFNFVLMVSNEPVPPGVPGVRSFLRTASNSEMTTTTANRPRLIIDFTAPLAGVPGDYNGNNIVDAADYVVWRENLGGDALAFAAGSRDTQNGGLVNAADYDFWKSHFGNSGTGGLSASIPAPEPSAIGLMLLGIAISLVGRRRAC